MEFIPVWNFWLKHLRWEHGAHHQAIIFSEYFPQMILV